MAMCTTIVSIRDKNIRHLYYGQPTNMFYRTSADYPNLDQLRIAKKEKELRENILKSSKQNYASAELEAAPAFRCVSAAEAEEIGKRLYAGHRQKSTNKEQKGSKGESGNGRTTNKNGSQTVSFKKESQQGEAQIASPPPKDSTESSPTPQK